MLRWNKSGLQYVVPTTSRTAVFHADRFQHLLVPSSRIHNASLWRVVEFHQSLAATPLMTCVHLPLPPPQMPYMSFPSNRREAVRPGDAPHLSNGTAPASTTAIRIAAPSIPHETWRLDNSNHLELLSAIAIGSSAHASSAGKHSSGNTPPRCHDSRNTKRSSRSRLPRRDSRNTRRGHPKPSRLLRASTGIASGSAQHPAGRKTFLSGGSPGREFWLHPRDPSVAPGRSIHDDDARGKRAKEERGYPKEERGGQQQQQQRGCNNAEQEQAERGKVAVGGSEGGLRFKRGVCYPRDATFAPWQGTRVGSRRWSSSSSARPSWRVWCGISERRGRHADGGPGHRT